MKYQHRTFRIIFLLLLLLRPHTTWDYIPTNVPEFIPFFTGSVTAGALDQYQQMAFLTSGNYVLAWMSVRVSGSQHDIWYIVISPDGKKINGPAIASDDNTAANYFPSVAGDSNGGLQSSGTNVKVALILTKVGYVTTAQPLLRARRLRSVRPQQ
jgi:hypothetical protein